MTRGRRSRGRRADHDRPARRIPRPRAASTRATSRGRRSTAASAPSPSWRGCSRPSASSRPRSRRWSASCASRATSTTPATPSASPRTAAGSTPGAPSGSSAGCSRSGVDRELDRRGRRRAGPRGGARARRSSCSRRRFPSRRQTPRERDRALGVLVRKGYELELAHDALRRHAGVARRAARLSAGGGACAVCAERLAVLRSGASDRPGRRGPETPANQHFLQADPAASDVTAIHDTRFGRRTPETRAGAPGHTDPTAHLAAI